jgi:hypothetical protein
MYTDAPQKNIAVNRATELFVFACLFVLASMTLGIKQTK